MADMLRGALAVSAMAMQVSKENPMMINRLLFAVSAILILSTIVGCGAFQVGGDRGPALEIPPGATFAPAGTYNGAYINTSGPAASGTGSLTFDSGGYAVLTLAGGVAYTGTLRGSTLSVTSASGKTITGTIAKTGTYYTLSYTDAGGGKGTFPMGMAPTNTPLAGSYNGTYTASFGPSGNFTQTISPSGLVGTAVSPTGGSAFGAPGSVDMNGNFFLHTYDTDLSSYQILVGDLALHSGPSVVLSGSLVEIPSGKVLTVTEK